MEQNFNSKIRAMLWLHIIPTYFLKLFFITNNYNNEFNIQKDHDKICKYYKKILFKI